MALALGAGSGGVPYDADGCMEGLTVFDADVLVGAGFRAVFEACLDCEVVHGGLCAWLATYIPCVSKLEIV